MSVAERIEEMVLTKDVLDHHLKSFSEGDLQGILSDYAPGAVLFTPDGPLTGADGITSRATTLTFCGPQRRPTMCTR